MATIYPGKAQVIGRRRATTPCAMPGRAAHGPARARAFRLCGSEWRKTWDEYRGRDHGRRGRAARRHPATPTDFMGWYSDQRPRAPATGIAPDRRAATSIWPINRGPIRLCRGTTTPRLAVRVATRWPAGRGSTRRNWRGCRRWTGPPGVFENEKAGRRLVRGPPRRDWWAARSARRSSSASVLVLNPEQAGGVGSAGLPSRPAPPWCWSRRRRSRAIAATRSAGR